LQERHVAVGSHAGEAFPLAVKRRAVPEEERSHRRLSEAPMLVAYTIGADFAAARTETYDIGLGGLAMLSESALNAGQVLDLELELRGDPRPPLRLAGEVRWCRHDPAIAKYRIGIEFTERTADQESQLRGYVDTMSKLRDLGVL
jgi:c-di-GMP-binding flagellar brake protein YcgR